MFQSINLSHRLAVRNPTGGPLHAKKLHLQRIQDQRRRRCIRLYLAFTMRVLGLHLTRGMSLTEVCTQTCVCHLIYCIMAPYKAMPLSPWIVCVYIYYDQILIILYIYTPGNAYYGYVMSRKFVISSKASRMIQIESTTKSIDQHGSLFWYIFASPHFLDFENVSCYLPSLPDITYIRRIFLLYNPQNHKTPTRNITIVHGPFKSCLFPQNHITQTNRTSHWLNRRTNAWMDLSTTESSSVTEGAAASRPKMHRCSWMDQDQNAGWMQETSKGLPRNNLQLVVL